MFLKKTLSLIALLIGISAFGQKDNFSTTKEYLEYSRKNFHIPEDEIYYVSTVSSDTLTDRPLEKFSLLMFFKNDKITTIEDVSMNSACPAPRLIKKATLNAIESSMMVSKTAGSIVFKNMKTGELFKPNKDELIAVLFYSYKFGSSGQQYIKERKKLSENLGIKTIIISIDGAYIKDLTDTPKNEIELSKG